MEKSEFVELMYGQYDLFYKFLRTENLDTGENVFHTCRNCTYSTSHIRNIYSAFDGEKIDKNAIEHVWNTHRKIAEQTTLEYLSQKIASKPGQQRLA